MSGESWRDDIEELTSLVASGETDIDRLAAAFPHRSRDAVRIKAAELKRDRPAARRVPDPHNAPDFGEPPKEPINVLEWCDRAITRTTGHEKAKDYYRIVIKTDKPIAVMFSADWHFGGLDVDYVALKRHYDFLLNVPGFYTSLVGDLGNMMNLHRTASVRRDILTPDEQAEFLHNIIHQTVDAGKLLTVNSGNHDDEFTERSAGFGLLKLMAKGKVPYFRGHGYLDLVLQRSDGGEVVYPIGLAHKTRFSSYMNKLHGAKRMEQMSAEFFGVDRPIPRVFVTAHHHNPAMSTEGLTPEDRIIFVKCGTFKTDCTYSQRYFGQGRIGVPTIVFHPDRREHVGLPTPFEAYRYMSGEDWEDAA